MATDIVMPRLSDSMEEGTILRWMKSVGDEVERGEELVEIETDKANMVYEAPDGGTLIEVVADEGETLPIGQVIARVGEPGAEENRTPAAEPSDAASPSSAATASTTQPSAAKAPSGSPTQPSPAQAPQPPSGAPSPEGDGRVKASPIARRIAKEKGLDLA